jgi:protein disulfide-isomerase A1
MLLFLVALFAIARSTDEKDVVVLTTSNFDEFIQDNEFVLAEFYAPWCGHCKKLTPEYAAAATSLKESGSPVKLAKIDATVESSLGERFGVRGYPTLKFFRSGSPVEYDGGRTSSDIITWVTKKSGPPSKHLTSADEVATFLGGSGTRAIAFAPSSAETWESVGKSEKTQAFTLAHITDASLLDGRKEGTVELHKDGESALTFDGEFDVDSLVAWLQAEGFPLVDELSQDSWTRAQNTQTDLLAVFYNAGGEVAANEAALAVSKDYKGKLVVTSSSQIGIATRWGSSGAVAPTAIYVSNQVAGQPSFVIWNEEKEGTLDTESLKAFVTGAQDGSYESYIKSEAIPADNTGPVTTVVGKNFDQVVRSNKDVLIEFYAPWCGHCKKLEPIYGELGSFFANDDNIVIAKMDATANGTPKDVSIQGFPTILFFDANNKVVSYDGERELEAFKTWLSANRVSKATGEKEDL